MSNFPVPDPTQLTTEALHREINALRDLLETRLDAASDLSLSRLKAIEDRFSSIEGSIQIALQAQKELAALQETANQKAIDKTEKATEARLVDLAASNKATAAGLHSKIDDLKDRVSRIENRKEGAQETKEDNREAFASLRNTATVIVGALTLAVGYSALHHNSSSSPTVTVPTVLTITSSTP